MSQEEYDFLEAEHSKQIAQMEAERNQAREGEDRWRKVAADNEAEFRTLGEENDRLRKAASEAQAILGRIKFHPNMDGLVRLNHYEVNHIQKAESMLYLALHPEAKSQEADNG